MRAAKGKTSLVAKRFMQKCRTFDVSPFSNEDRLNLRTISEYTRKRLERKVDERHGWALKDKTTELETKVVNHLNQKAKWVEEKNVARKRAKNERAKYKEHLQKVGAAVTKLEGHVMDVQTDNKTLSRQLVQEMGRSKASDAVTKKVQMQLHNVSVGMENLREKNEAVATSLLAAKEENLAHKQVVALAMQESGRVSKELKDLKAGRQARFAAEQRKWKKMERQKDSLEQKMQDNLHVIT
jgi:chromosome segregation ATPase